MNQREKREEEERLKRATHAAERLLGSLEPQENPIRAEWLKLVSHLGQNRISEAGEKIAFMGAFALLGKTEKGKSQQDALGKEFGCEFEDFRRLVEILTALECEKRKIASVTEAPSPPRRKRRARIGSSA